MLIIIGIILLIISIQILLISIDNKLEMLINYFNLNKKKKRKR